MSAGFATGPAAMVTVEVFDGSRRLYSGSEPLLITVMDGNDHTVSRDFHQTASVRFALPFHDDSQDQYTFIAWSRGHRQAGFTPVHVSDKTEQLVRLMLLPESNSLNFANAKWNLLQTARPKAAAVLGAGAADAEAAGARYSDLEDETGGEALASLLNILTVMDQIFLPAGTPLDYLRMVNWELQGDFKLARDRFFGWADPALIRQLDLARAQGTFVDAPAGLHPGATRSYKQIQFGEANLQLTFHERDTKEIGGITCVRLEPDIDYYRDAGAHLLLEVLVNAFGGLSDPRTVYVLRWIAGQRAGIPAFDPVYTITEA